MKPSKPIQEFIRFSLGFLLALLALNAFGGGYYGMAGAKNIPTEWLNGSPFRTYFIPGLFLFLVVGGSALIAAIAVFRKSRFAYIAALFSGILVILWLAVQVLIIGYVSWMQPTAAFTGILILMLTWLLYKYDTSTNNK